MGHFSEDFDGGEFVAFTRAINVFMNITEKLKSSNNCIIHLSKVFGEELWDGKCTVDDLVHLSNGAIERLGRAITMVHMTGIIPTLSVAFSPAEALPSRYNFSSWYKLFLESNPDLRTSYVREVVNLGIPQAKKRSGAYQQGGSNKRQRW